MNTSTRSRSLTAGVIACATALAIGVAGAPTAAAKNGDTHITGQGLNQTIDCGGATLFVNGADNHINALGSCWAVTMQGSNNTVIADNVVNDITVYGSEQTVLYKSGEPGVVDRGRELAMTNHIDRIPG